MHLLLAQLGTQPPITVNVPAPVVNNVSTGSWAPLVQAATVLLAGLVAAVLVHWFTQRRERIQKLREGYAEFAAEAFRYLRYEALVAFPQMNRTILEYQFTNATQTKRDTLNPRIAALDQEVDRLVKEAAEVTHRLRSAECKLVMLLGRSDEAIRDVNLTYRRLRAVEYRDLPDTKPLPHDEKDIAGQPLGAQEQWRYHNRIVCIENMRLDIESWIVDRSKEISRVEMFGDLKTPALSQSTQT